MIKNNVIIEVEKYLNDVSSTINLVYDDANAKEIFLLNTVKRLMKSYELYSKKAMYKFDYILALRDYLIVYDTSIKLNKADFLDNNEFGIVYDDIEDRYFASYQLNDKVNEKFVKEAFLRNDNNNYKSKDENIITDAFIYNITGYSKFKSLEQKIAVYGALNTPVGYTTLVSLPTGGGKSLITQTISYQKEGLTVVIIPTVSLALDQERVMKSVIKREYNEKEIFYYSSGVNVEPILKAIKNNKAKVLFISPEALLENKRISKTIKEANSNRYLKNIVIDEAHMIVDWGASFRVDYQFLEAWRNMLLMSNPSLRTILLSATFEERCVGILKNFFSVNDRWIEIRCDALRREPRYWVLRTANKKEKNSELLDLVRKLPHPMIIYVARPIDAEEVMKMLIEFGINNIRTFTGCTSKSKRKKLIDEWAANEFGIMIATSAFGVGVDKGDVRTVIHTYIPQNANTYYQELGRGGRDRLPCLSIMCLQPEDTVIGRDRIIKKVLTSEKIIGRWDSLYNNRKSKRFSNHRVLIDTSIKPIYSDIDEFDDIPTSDADMNWNLYVLLFLRRYNMIKILEVTIESGYYMVLIKIEDDRLLIKNEALEFHIQNIREKEWNYYSSSYKVISQAVSTKYKDCMAEMFANTYSYVYEFCAGCNAHSDIITGDINKFPLKNRVAEPLRSLSAEQEVIFGNSSEIIVILKNEDPIKLLEKLIQKGTSLIILPDVYADADKLLECTVERTVFIVSVEEAYQLIRKKGFYFTSGLVSIVYPKNEQAAGQQYVTIKNNLCGNPSTKLIHIVEDNIYIKEVGKTIVEIVDGPSISSNLLYS